MLLKIEERSKRECPRE